MTAPIGITLGLDGVQQTEAGLRRVAGGVDAVGVSAKQTAAALRGVPAQFTDIVTSLASGQQPLTVFLQQGGQLKDMFGGAGNAAKALGGYVVGLVNPFTVAAAAGVALALAYKQGSAEADAYARSIALTGNAAGVTTSQLQGMAERVSAVAGTQSKAAEVVAQLVGTGSVASQSLEQFTATAIRLERNAGVAVKDTVKEFAELGKEPVEAAKKLNERYNYLTAAVYEQIKALKDQGKASEAAALSQESYDKAMSLTAATLEGRLGVLERGWRAVADAAKSGWDAMLNVGRQSTVADEIGRVRTLIANKETGLDSYRDTRAGRIVEGEIEALRQKLSILQEQERMTRRGAEAQAERAKAEKAGIEAADALLKTQDKGLSKQQQMNAALKEYRTQLEALRAVNPNSERLAPDAVARGERAIRDQFKDSGNGAPRAGESELASLKARADAAEKYLQQLRTVGVEAKKMTDGEKRAAELRELLTGSISGLARKEKELLLVQAERLGVAERASLIEEQHQKAIKKSADEYDKLIETTFKSADALQDQADKQEAANAVYGKGAAAIDELALATLKSRMAEAQASDSFSEKYIAALEAQIQAQKRLNDARAEGRFKEMNESLDRELAAANQQAALYQDELRLTGLSALERAKIVALRQSELELARDLEKIEQGGFEDAEKEQLRIKAREKQRVAGSAAVNKVIQDDFTRTSETIERSLTDALLRGFESGKSFAKNLRDTIANMFKTLVLRPIISAVVNPVAGAITGALGLAGTASAGTSALGAVSTAASGASLLGNAAGLLGGAGTAAGYGFSALMSGNGLGALSGGLGMLTSGGPAAIMAQGVGMIAGVLGPIALGIGALTAIIGKTKGETRTGGQFGVAFDGSVTNQRRGQTYTIEGQQFDRDFTNGLQTALKDGIAYRLEGDPVAQESAIREAVAGTASGINGFLKALGSSATLTGFSAGFETSTKDRGGNFAGGTFNNGATFGESGKGDNYAGTLYEKFSTNSPDFKTALENFALDLKQSTIQALQTVSDIPQAVQKLLKGVDAEGLTEDATNKLLESINAQIVGVNQFKDALKGMGLDTLAALSFDAAAGLAEVSGGFDKLLGNLQTYYTNFFTGEEQRANLQRSLAEQLSTLGLRLPDINSSNARDQFRALVSTAEKDMSESGRKTYATLLALSGAFASITEAAQTTTQTLDQQRQAYYGALQDAVSARNKSLQSQLSAAQEVAGTLDNLFGILRSNVRDLYGEVDGTRGMLAGQGNAFIDQALATAKKSGYLPDADKLTEAIAAARGGIDAGGYTSQFAADRDRLVLAGKLSGLEKITEKQLTDAQRTVKALETQIDQNEQVLDYWKQQIDIASGTYDGILSVEAAVQQLSAALGGTGTGKPGGANTVGGGSTPASGTGAIPRTSYGADEALTSFEKFKAWYTGLKSNADPSKLMGDGYQVPDWLRVSNFGADSYSDKDLFGSYLFFKNNPQYAQDYQQIIDTGRSSYATDGSTLQRTDLSKLPKDIADYYSSNRNELLATEGFGLDPVLAYQLYNFGPGQFGLDGKKQSFTEWLQNTKWTPDGLVSNNNVVSLAQMGYSNYNLARWQLSSGNIVDRDGTIYTPEGKRVGRASQAQFEAVYGAGAKPTGGMSGTGDDYLTAIKTNIDSAINSGWSAQQLADGLISTGTSLKDVAEAYGISVEQVKENLINGGATNIPKFAVGTNYVPRDMLAMVHEGEQIIPKAFNPMLNPDANSGGAELVLEVRALREAVAALEAAASATAKNTAGLPQMADQFDTVAANGVVRVTTA